MQIYTEALSSSALPTSMEMENVDLTGKYVSFKTSDVPAVGQADVSPEGSLTAEPQSCIVSSQVWLVVSSLACSGGPVLFTPVSGRRNLSTLNHGPLRAILSPPTGSACRYCALVPHRPQCCCLGNPNCTARTGVQGAHDTAGCRPGGCWQPSPVGPSPGQGVVHTPRSANGTGGPFNPQIQRCFRPTSCFLLQFLVRTDRRHHGYFAEWEAGLPGNSLPSSHPDPLDGAAVSSSRESTWEVNVSDLILQCVGNC